MLLKPTESLSEFSLIMSQHFGSPSCAHADWEEFHSLLCIGKGSKALSTEALLKFIQHANGIVMV